MPNFVHLTKCRTKLEEAATLIYLEPRKMCQLWQAAVSKSMDEFLSFLANTISTLSTRSSADADNRLDAFSGQSRSTNMVPFHMLHIASYCAIVTLSLTIFVFKKFHDLEMGVKGHSRSLRVLSFHRLCMVSY